MSSHGGSPKVNDVALLAVGVVFAGTATVVIHLFKLAVNAQHKTDARHDVRIVAVTFARKLNVNMPLRGNLPAVGAAHAEIENRRAMMLRAVIITVSPRCSALNSRRCSCMICR